MIPVQFDKAWELPLDARASVVRKFTAGLVVELDEEAAAAAIAVGVAHALVDLPEHVAAEVGRNRRFLDDVDSVGLEEALARLDAAATAPAGGGGDGAAEAGEARAAGSETEGAEPPPAGGTRRKPARKADA